MVVTERMFDTRGKNTADKQVRETGCRRPHSVLHAMGRIDKAVLPISTVCLHQQCLAPTLVLNCNASFFLATPRSKNMQCAQT